jgi:hypothetical protein
MPALEDALPVALVRSGQAAKARALLDHRRDMRRRPTRR